MAIIEILHRHGTDSPPVRSVLQQARSCSHRRFASRMDHVEPYVFTVDRGHPASKVDGIVVRGKMNG
jgi:hypothetical protein